jgi:hypothetical protein
MAVGPIDLAGSQSLSLSLVANFATALPYAVAWPLASYISGFRTLRTLFVTVIIYILSWITAGVYWETMSFFTKSSHFPIDREIIANVVVMAAWATFIPRMRRISYFAASLAVSLFGATANYLIAHIGVSWSDFFLLLGQYICLNLPMFVLIGYGLAHR